MTELLSPLCRPALAFLILAILVYCAVVVAGRAADDADETWRHIVEEQKEQ